MRFNFKKVASVLASAVMLSSTIGMAAAAAYPEPFVVGGADDVAIVVGQEALFSDFSAALDVQTNLNALVAVDGDGSVVTGGDSVKIETETDLFNLGNEVDDFYSTLYEEQLSTVLADGTYKNDENDEFDYEQTIVPGDGLTLTHFGDSDFNNDMPAIGFDLDRSQHILNYTLEFDDAAEAGGAWTAGNDLETTDITMLGRTYYILQAENSTGATRKLTLLDSANSAIITQGETPTITVDGTSYSVSIEWVDADEVILNVDGTSTNKLSEGGTYKLADGETYIAVKNNLYSEKTGEVSKVEISIGSGKLEIEQGAEVKINGEDISNTEYDLEGTSKTVTGMVTGFLETTGNNLNKIVIEWKTDDEAWLMDGSDLLLPGFETIKLSVGEFNTPAEETTLVDADGDDAIQITTTIKDGEVTIPFLSLNSSQSAFDELGKDADEQLVTSNDTNTITLSLSDAHNTMFVATWINGDDYESYAYKIKKIERSDGDNKTTLENMADGSEVSLTRVGYERDVGKVTLNLSTASYADGNVTVKLTKAGSSGTLYADRIVTAEGLQFTLPVLNTAGAGGPENVININATTAPTSWVMNFTEEDQDGQIHKGTQFNVTMGVDADDGGEPASVNIGTASLYETEDDSDKYIGYVVSDLATEVLHDRPTSSLKSLTVTYHGTEAYQDVFIAESGAVVSPGDGAAGGQVMVVRDNEMSSVSGKNLIVVGGSCINTVAAQILGSTSPLCGADFTAVTNVGVGQYIIQTVASPLNEEKVAMLVAGYEAADTTNAVNKVLEGEMATDVGTSQVYPIVSA